MKDIILLENHRFWIRKVRVMLLDNDYEVVKRGIEELDHWAYDAHTLLKDLRDMFCAEELTFDHFHPWNWNRYSEDLNRTFDTGSEYSQTIFVALLSLFAKLGVHEGYPNLNLSQLNLHTLPHNMENFKDIIFLKLRENFLSELPEGVSKMSNLTHLFAEMNQITEIPSWIGDLTQLHELNLGSNQISEIPESFIKLKKLDRVTLYENQIVTVNNLAHNPRLTYLDLEGNEIMNMNPLTKLRQLHTLDLRSNRLNYVPVGIGRLKKLVTLKLCNNRISKLPSRLGDLEDLQYLTLTKNQHDLTSWIPSNLKVNPNCQIEL